MYCLADPESTAANPGFLVTNINDDFRFSEKFLIIYNFEERCMDDSTATEKEKKQKNTCKQPNPPPKMGKRLD